MPVIYANNVSDTIVNPITDSQLTLIVSTIANWPVIGANDYLYATLQSSIGLEIVRVTAINVGTSTFTIERGAQNSIPSVFAAGDTIELRLTSGLVVDVLAETLSTIRNGVPANRDTLKKIADAFVFYATLVSPQLTGVPTAPTPAIDDDTTKIATTAFSKRALDELANNILGIVADDRNTLQELSDLLDTKANLAALSAHIAQNRAFRVATASNYAANVLRLTAFQGGYVFPSAGVPENSIILFTVPANLPQDAVDLSLGVIADNGNIIEHDVHNFDNITLQREDFVVGAIYSLIFSGGVWKAITNVRQVMATVISHTLYIAWRDDNQFTAVDATGAESDFSDNGVLTIPVRANNGYLAIYAPVSEGFPSSLLLDGNPTNVIGAFTPEATAMQVVVAGSNHYILVSTSAQNAAILGTGSRTYTVEY